MIPFKPIAGATVNIVVSAASQRVAVSARSGGSIRVQNNGTATVWIDFGTVAVAASLAASMPVGAGVTEVFQCPDVGSAINVAAIAAGATGTIYFTPGEGV